MNVNIKNYIRRLRSLGILDTIVEAVANSLQATSTQIDIYCYYLEQFNFKCLRSVIIRDNGRGFHKDNRKSFNTFMSDYKADLGCRGVGRFIYLKVFSFVSYESVYEDNGKYKKVNFVFTPSFDNKKFKITDATETNAFTELRLHNLHKEYESANKSAISVSEIKKYLTDKLLVEFSLSDNFSIKIHDNFSNEEFIHKQDLPSFSEDYFKFFLSSDRSLLEQSATELEFKIQYYFKSGIQTAVYYCTERRIVKAIDAKIILPNDLGGIFLISSNFLDKYVNDIRTNYDVPKDSKFKFALFEKELKKKLSEIITNAYPEIIESNKEISEEIQSKYPYLKRYITTTDHLGIVNSAEIIKEAIKTQRAVKDENIQEFENLQQSYHSMLHDHKIDQEFVDKFVAHIDATTEINKETLVEFVWYADTIINFLTELVGSRAIDESIIHNIIIKKGKILEPSQDIIQAKQNNMWIFGHQFMGYKYIASDKKINEILGTLDQQMVNDTFSGEKPDIFMVMPEERFVDVSDIIIFEFKKPGVTYFEKTKGITQIETYVDALRDNINSISMAWGYLVIDFDEKIESRLRNESFHKTYTENGFAYTKYNDTRKLLLTVLDLNGLLSMAKNRNKIFTDILDDVSPVIHEK